MNAPTEYSAKCGRRIPIDQGRADELVAAEKQYARLINLIGLVHANFSSVQLAGLLDIEDLLNPGTRSAA